MGFVRMRYFTLPNSKSIFITGYIVHGFVAFVILHQFFDELFNDIQEYAFGKKITPPLQMKKHEL